MSVATFCACAGKRARAACVDNLSEISLGQAVHALSMPEIVLRHNISNSLRCYKGETLCKPLFYKTVLQWQLACNMDFETGIGQLMRQCCRQALKKMRRTSCMQLVIISRNFAATA
ncbi:MAG TPA: hypothetical protein VFE79_16865 [Paraburkholderia sp.]|jgi:hypothetical protein|nr:hypothetical protein [Paraburkholderia sp.]